ncbi:MAG: N-carbamoyl-D-amino-acid hydrolase [Ferrovibrio sp.]|uniref:N-carbamoyl-D-amino-acid hydrolase n=1 Tax=Ferrovibrio sp. TaxID=1917215 RepID=UPI00262A9B99|nr:N-carbamoyl-D-amino-acid hydrolase [Ferrovibrio sp.]MCW0235784.1 N-carbamoyl-D-amino-acid hydrolase [Ferrovibrio sp.]
MSTLKRPYGLAVAQLGPINLADSRAAVVKRLIALLREAHARGAKFVVFPELALTTFFPRYWMSEEEAVERFFERSMPGPETKPLFDLAAEFGIGFYLGYAELTPDGRRFNTSILTDETARIVGRYRKIHLPGHSHHIPTAPFQHLEKKFFEVGNEGFMVWETLGARIGMCICNDRRWAETYRVMGLQSAEIVALGYNTPSWNIHWSEPPHLRMFHHLLSLQGNAYQNGIWVAAAAKCGKEDGFHMIGGSAIVAPTGEIVAQAQGEDDELIFTNADLALGETFREHVFNFAKHRRPEHYGLIVERTGAGAPLGRPPE